MLFEKLNFLHKTKDYYFVICSLCFSVSICSLVLSALLNVLVHYFILGCSSKVSEPKLAVVWLSIIMAGLLCYQEASYSDTEC